MSLLKQTLRKPRKKEEPVSGSSGRRYTTVTEHFKPSKLDHDVRRTAGHFESRGAVAELTAQASAVSVIVKVREPGYVPPQVTVRSKLSPLMFTAELPEQSLSDLANDPLVVAVSTPKLLRNVD